MRLRLAMLLLPLVLPATIHAQRGVPQNGFPVWQERMLQVLFNRVRVEPTADPKACSSNTVRPPLVYAYAFNRSARFHSSNLKQAGCFQHNSPCLLRADLPSRYLPDGACDGAPACACSNAAECDASCTATTCTQTFSRIALFASGASGEIIAGGQGSPRSAVNSWMNSSGHCAIILGAAGRVGTGWYGNIWTGNFGGSATPTGVLIAGGHEVGTSFAQFTTTAAQDVAFRVNYYAGAGPKAASVNVDGICAPMTLERGTQASGTWLATVPLSGTACRRYVFRFQDPAGNAVVLPETGSYGVGGSLATCPDWQAAAPPACGAVEAPPTIATPARAAPNPALGTSTQVTVLGADGGGESGLTYTWSASGPASVTFSPNGTNAAKIATASFTRAGTYAASVSISDAAGGTVSSSVEIRVEATLSSVSVSPSAATLEPGAAQQFVATGRDQFGQSLGAQPVFAWTAAGGGSVDGSGRFVAGAAAGGPFQLAAEAQGVRGVAQVTVRQAQDLDRSPPSVSLVVPVAGQEVAEVLLARAEASDDRGVHQVAFELDGSVAASLSADPWEATIDLADVSEGEHTLVAEARDAAGNVGRSQPVVFRKKTLGIAVPPDAGELPTDAGELVPDDEPAGEGQPVAAEGVIGRAGCGCGTPAGDAGSWMLLLSAVGWMRLRRTRTGRKLR